MVEQQATPTFKSPKSSRKTSESPRYRLRSKSVDSPAAAAMCSPHLSQSTDHLSSPKSSRRGMLGKRRQISEADVERVRAKMGTIRLQTDSEAIKRGKQDADYLESLKTPKSILRKDPMSTPSTKSQVHFESPSKVTPPAAAVPLECTPAMTAQGGTRTPRRFVTPRRRMDPRCNARKELFPEDGNM